MDPLLDPRGGGEPAQTSFLGRVPSADQLKRCLRRQMSQGLYHRVDSLAWVQAAHVQQSPLPTRRLGGRRQEVLVNAGVSDAGVAESQPLIEGVLPRVLADEDVAGSARELRERPGYRRAVLRWAPRGPPPAKGVKPAVSPASVVEPVVVYERHSRQFPAPHGLEHSQCQSTHGPPRDDIGPELVQVAYEGPLVVAGELKPRARRQALELRVAQRPAQLAMHSRAVGPVGSRPNVRGQHLHLVSTSAQVLDRRVPDELVSPEMVRWIHAPYGQDAHRAEDIVVPMGRASRSASSSRHMRAAPFALALAPWRAARGASSSS